MEFLSKTLEKEKISMRKSRSKKRKTTRRSKKKKKSLRVDRIDEIIIHNALWDYKGEIRRTAGASERKRVLPRIKRLMKEFD